MSPVCLKQFSLPRSGSNYLRYLFEHHFDVKCLVNIMGYKCRRPGSYGLHPDGWWPKKWEHPAEQIFLATVRHSKELDMPAPQAWQLRVSTAKMAIRDDNLHYLISIRDPYSWLYSICTEKRLPGLAKMDEARLRQLAIYWSDRVRQYFAFRLARPARSFVEIIRMEDARDEDRIMAAAQRLGLELKREHLEIPAVRVKKVAEKQIALTTDKFDERFFAERRYMRPFTLRKLRAVNEHLDPLVVEAAGYRVVEP